MEWTKLTKRNHYEEITERLRRLIEDGSLKPGDKLPPTKDLSERFGVGRSTTREALSALKAMGLIDIRQGGGCTVIATAPAEVSLPELQSLRLNRATVLELLEAREALEVSNAAIAAVKRTDEDLAAMSQIIAEMERAVGDDAEGERTDLLFHLTLARMTHNSIMVRLFESIVGQMETAIREVRRVELYANHTVAEKLYEEHSAIFHAVSEGNPEAASDCMRRHLLHVGDILKKYI
ncbi:FadR/GntR family transcriptional regulator [Cohnella faecalis]|uniref:FadR family transcriptional regulator n=1 Tax=Cohnella faecalis TaxID=2315694 RepID=A0A398CDL0_9BACL|nr:FadR/GntR family transcriptional regulator [Cohnella faecalis]RIE00793.1 FadR family transcriptional regulator [Cohnella faecalis]